MAIDTRDKRSSSIAVSSPWRGMLPLPDSAIGEGDRLHIAYLYSGISAFGIVVDGPFCVQASRVYRGGRIVESRVAGPSAIQVRLAGPVGVTVECNCR